MPDETKPDNDKPQEPKPLATIPAPGTELDKVVTFLDTATPQGRALLYNSLQGQDAKLGEILETPFELANFVAAPIALSDAITGEVKTCARVVLLTPQNERYSCVSDGVLNSLRSLCNVFGNPPWNPPITVQVRQQNSRAGNRFYILEMVSQSGDAQATPKP